MKNKNGPLSQSHKMYSSNANQLAYQNTYLGQKNQKEFKTSTHHLYSKSYVFDKQTSKNEQPNLRKTINYDKQVFESASKKKLNTFLRNTLNSAYSDKQKSETLSSKIVDKSIVNSGYEQKGYKALKSTNSSIKQQPNKESSYLKIIQKLSKKQKLINQLKQLSKFNITDLIRKPIAQTKITENKNNKFDSSLIQETKKQYKKGVMNELHYTQSNKTQRDIYEVKKYDYSPAYQEKMYQTKKMNTQMQHPIHSISSIRLNIHNDLYTATSSIIKEEEIKIEQTSPRKNLYKSRFQKSSSSSIKEQYKPFCNSNVYYTPKQVKNQENLKVSVNKINLLDFSYLNNNQQTFKKDNQINNYKTNRYLQTLSQPNTPLLQKSPIKTARNMVDVKKTQELNGYQDEPYNYKICQYIDINYSQPNTPLLKKRQQKKSYKDIQDIRIHSQKRIKANSNYFTLGRPKIYDFQLTKELGQGKFGIVYQAIHKQTNTIYAIKKLSKKNIKQNFMIDQLIKEIKIQSFCQHENILKLYGFFDDFQFVYLILQYMEQGTLFQQFKKQKTFNQKQTARIINQIAQGIKYLHQNGIIHRDIKPQNIVLSHGVGKLCDFGWATVCNGRRKTYCGTFDYVAPQILQGEQYDETVDLWCLGVLAYELLVGKAPFYHLSKKQTMKRILNVQNQTIQYPSHLSKQTISFIQNLIRKNPEERMNGKEIMKHPFILNANIQ